MQHALAAMVVGRLVDLLPEVFGPARIFADDQRRDLLLDAPPPSPNAGPPHMAASPQPMIDGSLVCTLTSSASRVWYSPRA